MTEDDIKKEKDFVAHQFDNVQYDWNSMFENGCVHFNIFGQPPTLQNKQEKKKDYREIVLSCVKKCPFIITSTCWVHINYYCKEIRRLKNPNVYDMDNIVKPILDALVGKEGLVVDDVLFDRVEVNWIDKNGLDEVEITIEYPNLLYHTKESLCFYKNGLWCFPGSKEPNVAYEQLLKKYFAVWNKINDENFDKLAHLLPQNVFISYTKIKEKKFDFRELNIETEM